MLGERSDQRGLWEADRLYLDHVGRESFYGLLASMRGWLFRDADFAEFYCPDNGRDSVPPSLLATALLLQSHDKVSDAEAKARADFDLRWKVALGIEVEDRPFAKSTLQVFRAQLILHDKVREVFESSLRLAQESGYLKKRSMKVALDTTNILGRGAVKDTCNLLADGIVKLLRALAAVEQAPVREWAQARGYERYLGSSVKGEAAIDWSGFIGHGSPSHLRRVQAYAHFLRRRQPRTEILPPHTYSETSHSHHLLSPGDEYSTVSISKQMPGEQGRSATWTSWNTRPRCLTTIGNR